MWSMTAEIAERDDPNGLPSNPFIFLLTWICLDNLRSSPLLPATITCHGESRVNFTAGAAFPKYPSVLPAYVEESPGLKKKKNLLLSRQFLMKSLSRVEIMSVCAAFVSARICTQPIPRWDAQKCLFVLDSAVQGLSFECSSSPIFHVHGQRAARLPGGCVWHPWGSGLQGCSLCHQAHTRESSVNLSIEMSWNNLGTLCFLPVSFCSCQGGGWRGKEQKEQGNFAGTMFIHLVADEIVTECSKAHFCLTFLLLVKLK